MDLAAGIRGQARLRHRRVERARRPFRARPRGLRRRGRDRRAPARAARRPSARARRRRRRDVGRGRSRRRRRELRRRGRFAAAEAAIGPLDVLVNNAGIADGGASLDTAPEAFDRVIATNLRGVWLMSVAAAERWRQAKRGGAIVNIASILGFRVSGGTAAYAVSKAGVVQMTQAHALEWARYGIRVNALAPGYIATDINAGFFETEHGAGDAEAHPHAPARATRGPRRRLPAPLFGRLALDDRRDDPGRRRAPRVDAVRKHTVVPGRAERRDHGHPFCHRRP